MAEAPPTDADRRPTLAWCAQAAAFFGAVTAPIAALYLLALTGGWASFDTLGPSAPFASDLQDGQFYQQEWINPDTGQPYSDEIDEISIDYARLDWDSAAPLADDPLAEMGWAEPLEGGKSEGAAALEPADWAEDPWQTDIREPAAAPIAAPAERKFPRRSRARRRPSRLPLPPACCQNAGGGLAVGSVHETRRPTVPDHPDIAPHPPADHGR